MTFYLANAASQPRTTKNGDESIKQKAPTKPKTRGQNLRLLPGFFTVKLFSLKPLGCFPGKWLEHERSFLGDGLFSIAMLVSGRLHELLIEKLTTEALSKWLRLQTNKDSCRKVH